MNILRSSLLAEIPGLVHGFTTRTPNLPDQGNVSLLQGDALHAIENRRIFAGLIGTEPSHLTFSRQEHGTAIRCVSLSERGAGAENPETSLPPADGLITSETGLPLAMMVADCACMIVSDRNGKAIGTFHSGWRGTLNNMPSCAVSAFLECFGIPPTDLRVWISPMICADCFEVGEEVWSSFRHEWGTRFLLDEPLRVDLPGLLAHQWRSAGVAPGRIQIAERCTVEDPNLFSHRRGGRPNGRMMGVACLLRDR